MADVYLPEGFFVTTLSAAINSSTTTIPLTAVPSIVTKGYMIIEPSHATLREVIHFTSVGASSVTTTNDTTDSGDATGRGCKGSITVGANTSHDQGVTVIIAASYNYWKRFYDKLTGNDATVLVDTNGNEILKVAQVSSAVNEITVTNAATGTNPIIGPTGDDSNIGLTIKPKGSGVVAVDGAENYAADSGSNDTYAITVTGISAYATGQTFSFKANTINTGAATLNVNSLGAKTIKKNYNSDLADGDIKANQIVEVIYDGTNFQLLSPISNSSTGVSVSDEDNSGGSSTTSSTFADITGADVSVTTTVTSNIVLIATISAYAATAAPYGIQFHDGTNLIGVEIRGDLQASNQRLPITIQTIATNKAAGTYSYTVRHRSQNNSTSCTAEAVNVIAIANPA